MHCFGSKVKYGSESTSNGAGCAMQDMTSRVNPKALRAQRWPVKSKRHHQQCARLSAWMNSQQITVHREDTFAHRRSERTLVTTVEPEDTDGQHPPYP